MENIVLAIAAAGMTRDVINTSLFTENEQEAFNRFCRQHNVKSADEMSVDVDDFNYVGSHHHY